MPRPRNLARRGLALAVVLLLGALAPAPPADAKPKPKKPKGGPTLHHPSKSSTVAINEDDSRVAMVNPEDDSVSIFTTDPLALAARVDVGKEPSAVVWHPDGQQLFVANRADGSVAVIEAASGSSPAVARVVEVGSEPTGLALSPTGNLLFVAEWAEGRVTVLDTTKRLRVVDAIAVRNPRALAVTNDGDDDDDDELLVVPEFFGRPVPGGEALDTGRTGRARVFRLGDLAEVGAIDFLPLDSGFAPVPAAPTVMTSANQLYAVAPQGGRVYVASVAASPAPPSVFNGNVFPVVYVGDLSTFAEDRSSAGTTNLAREVFDAIPAGSTRFALADIVDLDFERDTRVAYVLSRGADVLQRVDYDPVTGVTLGLGATIQMNLGLVPSGSPLGCQTPTGVVVANHAPRAYVNCWVSRNLGEVDLDVQALSATVVSTDLPADPAEVAVHRGARFFFTARGRWSREGWSGCGSCHPDGLSDNVTWIFAAGPRQTTALDGSYSHGPGAQKQRVFNWTAIFDEMHDFERNTRGTSGGLGAITVSPSGMCGTLAAEVQDPLTPALPGGLGKPIQEFQDRPENCTKDWDDVDAYVKTVRPPRGLRTLDAGGVARGRKLFGPTSAGLETGNCVACHGGQGWTLSRRFWTPSSATNMTLAATPFTPPPIFPATWNIHTLQIQAQPAAADGTGAPIAPPEVACVLRNLGTFGLPGDTTGTDALEKKPDGSRAQGRGGYNIPSLYGVAVGEPYLHHGQAATLEDLFTDTRWEEHWKAGNPSFLTGPRSAQDRADLISFLRSIDTATPEFAVPAEFEACPATFP